MGWRGMWRKLGDEDRTVIRSPPFASAPHRRVTVPDHKEIAKGTLRAILRQAGLPYDSLNALL
jgi:hypothetical protein